MRNTCEFPECGRHRHSGDYCNGHRAQLRKGQELRPLRSLRHPRAGRVCKFPDCGKPHSGKGYCIGHYQQYKSGRPLTVTVPRNDAGAGYVDEDGYRWITKNGVKKSEHRWVMEEMLGRELLPHENVHHKNGQRLDNRPENLELWSFSQPAGQRVEDKTVWAIEWLRQYQPEALIPGAAFIPGS